MVQASVITPEEACRILRDSLGMSISPETVRLGLQQEKFPFGTCIISEKSVRCYVYRNLLERWIAERECPSANPL